MIKVEFSFSTQIIVGNHKKNLNRHKVNRVISEQFDDIAKEYGGYTEFNCRGVYFNKDTNKLIKNIKTKRIELIIDDNSNTSKLEDKMKNIASNLEEALNQKKVLLTISRI